jgi:response regulator RpfG family c-di-GMP phosphodiesterase
VTVVTEDAAGRIWVGSLCGGLARSEGDRFVPVARPDGAPFGCVTALLAEADGSIWVGEHGLRHLGGARDEWYRSEEGLPSDGVLAVLRACDGALWIGTDAGLARLAGGRLEVLDHRHGLVDDRVHALAELSDGSLWIGTARGVSRYHDGEFRNLTVADGLPAGAVRAIWEGAGGEVWLGTYGGGLARIRGGEIATLTTEHGLAENVVSAIIPEPGGRLWLSGNRGISRLERDQLGAVLDSDLPFLTPTVLGSGDGLLSAECNGGVQPAGLRSRDGRLWFPTVAGLAVIEPDTWRLNQVPPPVAIEEVLVGGRPRPPRTPITLLPPRGSLEIRFTALTFIHPARARFRYRLEGFDPDWIDAGTRRAAYYTNLPPGRYRFEVTAANSDGVWNPRGTGLGVVARPRYYETAWFGLLCGALVLGLGASGYTLRVWRLKVRARALERTVAERTADLAAASRRAEQHLHVLRRQEAELRDLNENLADLVHQQTLTLEQTRDAAILTLARLAELRDGTTGAHLERIAAYSRTLAGALSGGAYGGLGDDFIDQLARSSPLHDIGKVAIPDAILRKAGPLTEAEREVMRSHTVIGGDTLRSVLERYEGQDYLTMAMHIAYSHHEHWDGRGYPRRLRTTDTPLPARIVALADVYDALTSERPYKPAYSHERALAEIVAARATHFDPHALDAFVRVADRFPRLHERLAG